METNSGRIVSTKHSPIVVSHLGEALYFTVPTGKFSHNPSRRTLDFPHILQIVTGNKFHLSDW